MGKIWYICVITHLMHFTLGEYPTKSAAVVFKPVPLFYVVTIELVACASILLKRGGML